ncbi:MAG: hypothetical protein ACIAQU_04865 [Phycisphaerales bacterium JB064]
MGLDISGRASTKKPADKTLQRIADYFNETYGDDLVREATLVEDGRGLLVSFAMTSDPIAFEAVGKSAIEVQCRWNHLGPGYCIFAWERLRALESIGLVWEELDAETGEPGTPTHNGAIKAIRTWMSALCQAVSRDAPPDASGVGLCMPMNWVPLQPQFASTPMGPRDRAWVDRVANDGAAGDDFFAWWNPDLGAATKLQLARAAMWNSVPWAPPAVQDDFTAMAMTLDWLERAYEEDGGLAYPWPEWAEIIRNFNIALDQIPGQHERPANAGMIEDRAAGKPGTIGYRRADIDHRIGGGWSLTLPGSFGTDYEEEEDHAAWLASDGTMTIRVSPARAPDEMPDSKEAFAEATREPEAAGVEWASDSCIGRGDWGEDDSEGQPVHMLQGISMADGRRVAFVTIMFDDPADRHRALATWHALRCDDFGESD